MLPDLHTYTKFGEELMSIERIIYKAIGIMPKKEILRCSEDIGRRVNSVIGKNGNITSETIQEIFSDIKTPIQVLKILKKKSNHVYLLESVENQERWGRYTFLGYKPTLCVTCLNNNFLRCSLLSA